ncbi:MAG: hypothetical protein JNM06_15195 [Blastocatellia bacterium]|nr:hypothetical protein [Blastocatellia bacterium]
MKEEDVIVRPELNFEKWPGIWQPIKSNNKLYEIVLERKTTDSISKVEITANSKYGPLTTEAQKILYALYKISEERGHPRRIYFSCNKIAKIIKKKWGKNAVDSIRKGLYQLRFTAFILDNVFYDSISKKRISSFTDTFTILSVLKISQDRIDGHVTKEACYCEFNEYIYNNLLNNYVKPTLLDVVLSFGEDGIAQSFYSHFDLLLANTNICKRPIEKSFQDINLIGKEYQKLSIMKRTFERIKPKLNGKRLSSGGTLEVGLEKTITGYDLVGLKITDGIDKNLATNVCKTESTVEEVSPSLKKRIEKLSKAMPEEPIVKNVNNDVLKTNNVRNESAKELIELFAKRFFNLEKVRATSKELNQAKQLIKDFGFETSKYIIGYAYNQACLTNYKIGQFGAIVEYAGRGAAQYEKDTKIKQSQQKLANCRFCNGAGYIDVIIDETKRTNHKLKCPHNLEQIETISKEKGIKIRLADGKIIEEI